MLRNQQTEALYAALSGKPARELPIPPEPVKRQKREPSPAEPRVIEADVSRTIFDLLRRHPRVAWFMRLNSGAVNDGDRYTVFYRLYVPGRPGISKGASDYLGQLTDGRLFLIEVKRPGVTRGTAEQEMLISVCKTAGGIAGIAQSVEDAVALLA
jgi:hypothetical protein